MANFCKWINLQQRTLVLAVILLLAATVQASLAAERQSYPEDPFALEYQRLPARAIGITPGQVNVTILPSIVSGNNSSDDVYFGGKLGSEYILNEFAGARFTLSQDILETNGKSLGRAFSSMRFGSSLHLFPYSRFDMGTFVEGGLMVVDAVDGKTGDKAPEVAAGGFMTFHIDSSVFIRAELERIWCNAEIDSVRASYHRTAASLGIGIAF